MNQFFIDPVIQDREREVATFAKYNQIEKDSRDSAVSQPEAIERWNNEVILGFSKAIKWLLLKLATRTDDSIKA